MDPRRAVAAFALLGLVAFAAMAGAAAFGGAAPDAFVLFVIGAPLGAAILVPALRDASLGRRTAGLVLLAVAAWAVVALVGFSLFEGILQDIVRDNNVLDQAGAALVLLAFLACLYVAARLVRREDRRRLAAVAGLTLPMALPPLIGLLIVAAIVVQLVAFYALVSQTLGPDAFRPIAKRVAIGLVAAFFLAAALEGTLFPPRVAFADDTTWGVVAPLLFAALVGVPAGMVWKEGRRRPTVPA